MQISRNILANTKIMDWDEAIITNDISHSWTILTCLSDEISRLLKPVTLHRNDVVIEI